MTDALMKYLGTHSDRPLDDNRQGMLHGSSPKQPCYALKSYHRLSDGAACPPALCALLIFIQA